MYLLFKYSITALIVVVVSEVARRSDRVGAWIASLPLVTILTLVWLFVENQPNEKLTNHMYYTFWYVLPTLPMFLAYPWLLKTLGFAWSLVTWCALTVLVFLIFAWAVKRLGIELI